MGLQTIRSLFLFFTAGTFATAYLFREVKFPDLSIREYNARKYFLLLTVLFALFAVNAILFPILITSEDVPLSLAQQVYLSVIGVLMLCILFKRDDDGFRFKLPSLPLKCAVITSFTMILFATEFVTSIRQRDSSAEFYKPAVDALLQHESPENIILWTGFNTGGYAEFRGIRSYIDPRAEIFMEVNNGKKDILKEYLDLRFGKTYYKDFFAQYNFTHALVTDSDRFVYQAISHDPNFRLIYEEKDSDNDIICSVFEIVDNEIQDD